jgi:hypothetical protein
VANVSDGVGVSTIAEGADSGDMTAAYMAIPRSRRQLSLDGPTSRLARKGDKRVQMKPRAEPKDQGWRKKPA